MYDVIIVGAGPAGLSAAARVAHHKRRYLVLEQGALANTVVSRYTRGKYVMDMPTILRLPTTHLPFKAGIREDVLQAWQDYVATCQITINIKTDTPVTSITKHDDAFEVQTAQDVYRAARVVLAIGTWGKPKRLAVPGGDLEHVLYTSVDPHDYIDQNIVLVGAGDSAAEVALKLSENNNVTMLNRSRYFGSMHEPLLGQIKEKIRSQEIKVKHNANVEKIEKALVHLIIAEKTEGRAAQGTVTRETVKADWVFVQIGPEMPTPFLQNCGVTFPPSESPSPAQEKKLSPPMLNERYESVVPGLFVIGSLTGKGLIKHALKQGYEVIEYICFGDSMELMDESILMEKFSRIPGASVEQKLEHIAASIPLLAAVSTQRLRELALMSTVPMVDCGHIIFPEGEYSTTLYTIVQGSVALSFQNDPNRRVVLRQGEFFGEMELLFDHPRSATATTAAEESILLEIPRRNMLRLVEDERLSVQQHIHEIYKLRALQRYLCPDLSLENVRAVAAAAELKSFQEKEVIFKTGDLEDAFYMILNGSVSMSTMNKDGKESLITYFDSGDYFGEIALLDEASDMREATATAATRVEVLRILKADFLEFLQQHPPLKEQLESKGSYRVLQGKVLAATTGSPVEDIIGKLALGPITDVLLIDETKCIKCDNCVSACAATHGGQTRLDRVRGPSFASVHVPVACRHCAGAPCLQDCDAGDAIVRDAQGVVQIYDHCIGCGKCANACPYHVIRMVEIHERTSPWQDFTNLFDLLPGEQQEAPRKGKLHKLRESFTNLFDSLRGKSQKVEKTRAIKCDLCSGITGGPACVRSCPTGAAIRVQSENLPTYLRDFS